MKTAQDYLDEANSMVPRVDPETGIGIHAGGEAVFIDVRDSKSLQQTGTIAGAHHVPRGMVELSADPDSPFHKPFLRKDAHICIVCGGGLMAAMAGKTLLEMGFSKVTNVGGMNAWKDAGGPAEEVGP
ncbi:MAG: rhodanese-like domain-containing protein [Paracoccaceae bacterium]